MTFSARKVLDDCELALEFLEQATSDQIWRVHWFAAVVLVRTVGDVLDKVDGIDPRYAAPIKTAYKAWQSDRSASKIFWEFIKCQRDRLVHEYDSDAHPTDKISLLFEMDLVSKSDGLRHKQHEIFELDENIYRPMLAGPWEGEDARDVLTEAIEWWKVELEKIDFAATKSPPLNQ
jgi:hypothetical protein